MIKKLIAIFTLFFAVMPLTFAWNATGHKLIAQIAYQQLNENARAQVDMILDESFINASVWADQVRATDKSMNTWHYINLPNPGPQKNVVDAIIDSQNILNNPKSTPSEKKFTLRGLIHWVADVHQPLHTTGRDRGATLFLLAENPNGKNLHQFWDNGAGSLKNIKNLEKTAKAWQHTYPPSKEQLKLTNPMQWAQEGYIIANTQAFVGISPKTVPGPSYIERAQTITQQQVVLAGARLAQVLNSIKTK